MKKTTIFLVTMVSLLIASCAVQSTYTTPISPNIDVTQKNMENNHIKTLTGAYMSYSQGITLYTFESGSIPDDKVIKGAVETVETFIGKKIFIPSYVPIFYEKGEKEDQPVVKDGKTLYTKFLSECSATNMKNKEVKSFDVKSVLTKGKDTISIALSWIPRFKNSES